MEAAVALLDGGSTVPFIARYRKEATGGLDDTQLRRLDERLTYLRELEERRDAILASIPEQGKLTERLAAGIARPTTKAELEDLYLPYKPKRRTKAQIAQGARARAARRRPSCRQDGRPPEPAAGFLAERCRDVKAALEGARDILVERFAENADLIGRLRACLHRHGRLRSRVIEGKEEAGAKFADYFEYAERWATIPGHRALALLRARNEEILALDIEVDADAVVAGQAGRADDRRDASASARGRPATAG